jgi:hypothetical protein
VVKYGYHKEIEQKAVAYKRSKMLRSDSKFEIALVDNNIWFCDYSPSRKGAEFIKILCKVNHVDLNQLIKLCNEHNWGYVI